MGALVSADMTRPAMLPCACAIATPSTEAMPVAIALRVNTRAYASCDVNKQNEKMLNGFYGTLSPTGIKVIQIGQWN